MESTIHAIAMQLKLYWTIFDVVCDLLCELDTICWYECHFLSFENVMHERQQRQKNFEQMKKSKQITAVEI